MDNASKMMAYSSRSVKASTVWLLFLFFGWSYGSLGSIGKQIFYWITCGGLGIWCLIRLFTLSGSIKDYNRKIAAECGLDDEQKLSLGLF